jgi:hypothetical protein
MTTSIQPLPAPRFALATCTHLPALTASDEVLRSALEAKGAAVSAAPWDQIEPGPGTVVCPRSTWDYFRRWAEFRRWLARFDELPGAIVNPLETLVWNADKIYLRELGAAGVAVPASRWFEPGERPDNSGFLRQLGTGRAVIKPRVSGAGYGTYVMEDGMRLSDAQWQPLEESGALLQAFVPEIAGGEMSLMYIAGRYTHAVLKRPAPGEFRVQSDHGGTVEAVVPSPALRAFAERALTAAARPWLYARVDVVETASGPLLMELELLEPELFFLHAPAAAERLAHELVRLAQPAGPAYRSSLPLST